MLRANYLNLCFSFFNLNCDCPRIFTGTRNFNLHNKKKVFAGVILLAIPFIVENADSRRQLASRVESG